MQKFESELLSCVGGLKLVKVEWDRQNTAVNYLFILRTINLITRYRV
jgi:hypothetical protein